MFTNCFPNTLDTTVEVGEFEGKPDTAVITGRYSGDVVAGLFSTSMALSSSRFEGPRSSQAFGRRDPASDAMPAH